MSKWDRFVKAFVTNGGYKTVTSGLAATLEIAFFGFLIGLIIGLVIASVKVAGEQNKVAKVISRVGDVYVIFFRGTPIIVQLLLTYYVLFPLIGIKINKLIVAILTFGMNSGAYVSEIMRGGILSVDKGQGEAGRSLGLGYFKTMTKIVLPQAFKNMLPSLGNEIIALVKDTSVVSFIAVTDLTNAFQLIGSGTYEFVIPYLMLAASYLVITLALTGIVKLAERRLKASERK